MSQQKPNICTHCGRPKVLTVNPQQAPRGAKWPTYWQDLTYIAKRFGGPLPADELVYVNGRRMGVPPIPPLVPPKEKITINPAGRAFPQNPQTLAKDKPVYVNGRRMGVPPPPPLIPPKEKAA
jgi:hypothetical protein